MDIVIKGLTEQLAVRGNEIKVSNISGVILAYSGHKRELIVSGNDKLEKLIRKFLEEEYGLAL